MQVVLIPPFDDLQTYAGQSMHLYLPHLGIYNVYKNFFVGKWDRKHIIMDNGAAEESQWTPGQLANEVRNKKPIEFALPDTMWDGEETVKQAMEWIKRLPYDPQIPTKLGYVAQGANGPEAFNWMCQLMASDEGRFIEIAYLPRLLVDSDKFARIWLANEIHEHWSDLEIHFFGANSMFPEEVLIAKQLPFVRSIDTSLPWQLAYRGEKLRVQAAHKSVSRTQDYFTRKWSPRELRLAAENVLIYKEWADA